MIELMEMVKKHNTLITINDPATDHREASEAISRRDMGDAGGGRRMRGSRKPVGKDLHRETADNRDTVGGATSRI